MLTVLFLLLAPTNGWWLSAADVKQIPANPSRFLNTRQAVEKRYYQTPYYDRPELIQRETSGTRGFERLCWLSLGHTWDVGSQGGVSKTVQGNLPTTSDREVLRARMLADRRNLVYTAFKPLAVRLMVGAEDDYQLQWAAAKSAFMIGGEPKQGLTYAQRALELRPDDPASWHIMASTYYFRAAYQVGDLQDNVSNYRVWAKKFSDYARRFPNNEAARVDLRVSESATKTVESFLRGR